MKSGKASGKGVAQRRRAKAWSHGFARRYGVARRCCVTLLCYAVWGVVVGGCGGGGGIEPQTGAEEPSHGADQTLIRMTHSLTYNGVLRAKVEADTTYMHSSAGMAYLRKVRITFYDPRGNEASTLTSKTGTYQLRSGDMEGRGNVVVLTEDGRRLTTEVLRYVQAKDSVTSDVPFVFEAPGRHIEGEGFVSDPSFRTVVAKQPRGTGGRFVLPNQ